MTDRPIIFSSSMVRALLEGRKTMTRRLLRPQPTMGFIVPVDGKPGWFGDEEGDNNFFSGFAPGYRRYVRESYAPRYFDGGKHGFKADWTGASADCVPEPKWKPAIHMPRWASRIALTVEAVKVERLQDISEEDAIAEGIFKFHGCEFFGYDRQGTPGLHALDTARETYAALWDSLNAKRAPWESNPWVVAPTFKVHVQNIDRMAA